MAVVPSSPPTPPGVGGSRGIGFPTVEVMVSYIADGQAHTTDSFGGIRVIPLAHVMGPNPRVGETWLISNNTGYWNFERVLRKKPPVIPGNRGTSPGVAALLGALDDDGLIVNQTTPGVEDAAADISFTPTGLTVITDDDVQGALGQVDASLVSHGASLTSHTASLLTKQGWARTVELPYTAYPTSQPTWTFNPVINNLSHFNGYQQSGGGAVVREMTYTRPMAAGSWWGLVYYMKGPNLGRLLVAVDGIESASFECYQASTYVSAWSVFAAPITIATSGNKVITIRQRNFKHTNSTDYFVLWAGVSMTII